MRRSNKAYAIETGAEGQKTIHSFISRDRRDAWVRQNPAARAEAPSSSKTVSSAIYLECVVAHAE